MHIQIFFVTLLSKPILIPFVVKFGLTYLIKALLTLWFWLIWISQVQMSVKNKAMWMPHRVYYIQSSSASNYKYSLVERANYILTSTWGFRRCISVVHWKTIFLICYLLDYQQVQENSNVSIILLGDKKEPTKWKTNLVQQILLPNNHFPCYFYFKNRFYWRKEKRCVTCLWLPTKANTQI